MERAKRSDAGQVKLHARDRFVFEFLVAHKAIYETDLRVLMGRYQDGDVPGPEAVRKAIGRWQRGGYARARKVMVDAPHMVALTPKGAAQITGEMDYSEQAEWTAYHSCEVARVRLWMETPSSEKWAGDWKVTEWQSEREFRAEKWRSHPKDGTKGMHVPDAVVTFANGVEAALEVERSDKTSKRLVEILSKLSVYPMTLYCSQSPRVRRHIRAVYDETTRKPKAFAIHDYPSELEVL